MRTLKFGGTSLADADRLRRVARLVCTAARREGVVVVVSALAGVTDSLSTLTDTAAAGSPRGEALSTLATRHLACLDALGGTAEDRRAVRLVLDELEDQLTAIASRGACEGAQRDAVLACGERMSVVLAAAALTMAGVTAQGWDTRHLVVTDSQFGRAGIAWPETRARLRRAWQRTTAGTVPVATGFIGATPDGSTTTLGRGGSDTLASIVAAALDADVVEIWSDVDGVLSAPPASGVKGTTVPHLSYQEAREAARFGAKVLHPDTVAPAARKGIPLAVRNTFRPDGPRTIVGRSAASDGGGARVVTCIEAATLVGLPEGVGCEAPCGGVDALRCEGPAPFPNPWVLLSPLKACPELATRGQLRQGVSAVAVVGDGIAARPEARAALRDALRNARIPVLGSVATRSGASVAIVVPRGMRHEAVRVLHGALVAPQRLAAEAVAEGGENHG